MRKILTKFMIIAVALIGTFTAYSMLDNQEVEAANNQITNGDFETGDLTGWTTSCSPGISTATTFWGGNYNPQGTYHFQTSSCGTPPGEDNDPGTPLTTLTSSTFTLAGSGYISFLLGAAPNQTTYVAIKKASDDTEVARVYNDKFVDSEYSEQYIRRYVDLSAYDGLDLYIEVVDNESGGWGHINVDDFITYYENAPSLDITIDIDSLARWEYDNEPVWNDYVGSHTVNYRDLTKTVEEVEYTYIDLTYTIDSSSVDMTTAGTYSIDYDLVYDNGGVSTDGGSSFPATTVTETRTKSLTVNAIGNQITNGSFETGDFTGWYADGAAFCSNGLITADTYWDQNLPYNQDQSYHFYGADCGEDNTGTLTSTRFTLGGSGYMSILLGAGPDTSLLKVNVMDDATDTVVATIANTNWEDGTTHSWANGYIRYYVDLVDAGATLGDRLYIQVVDDNVSTGGFRFINVDDVDTYHETVPTLTNSNTIAQKLEVNATEETYSDLIETSPNYKNPTVSVTETVDTTTLGDYNVTYTVDYQGLSTEVVVPVEVLRAVSDVTVISYFDDLNQPQTTVTGIDYGSVMSFDDSLSSDPNYEFQFWVVDGKIRTDLAIDHQFVVTYDMEVKAFFSDKSTSPQENVVLFIDTNGTVLDVQYVLTGNNAADVTENLPDKPGYIIDTENKWNASLDNIQQDTYRYLQYAIDTSDTYDLTVVDASGSQTGILYNTLVSLTPDASNPDPFMYWEVNGIVASYDEEYKFTMLENKTVTAVYGTGTVTPTGTIIKSSNLDLRTGYDSYLMQFYVPSGATLIEWGLLGSDQVGTLTLETSGVTVYQSFKYLASTNEFVLTIPDTQTNTRAYLVYEDNGQLVTVYAD